VRTVFEKMIKGKLCKDDESKFYMVEALLEGDASDHWVELKKTSTTHQSKAAGGTL